MSWITEQEYLETVEESRNKLIATARGYCIVEDDAEDAVQDAVIYCLGKLEEFDPTKSSVITWTTTSIIQRAKNINYYRERETGASVLNDNDYEEEEAEREHGEEDNDFTMGGRSSSTEASYTPDYDTKISVQQALAKLPEVERKTAIAVLIEGYTEQEYADSIGVTDRTVRRYLAEAKKKLRVLLSDAV